MKYKLIQKANPRELRSQRKWYVRPVKAGTVDNRQISNDIVAKSTLTKVAVMYVIENMANEIPRYLMEGYSVSLSDLGTLRLSLSSEGADTPEKCSPESIKNVRVIFTPSPEFKRTLQNVQYEKTE